MANKTIAQLEKFPLISTLANDDMLIMYDVNKDEGNSNTKSITIEQFKNQLDITGTDSRISQDDINNWNNKVDSQMIDGSQGIVIKYNVYNDQDYTGIGYTYEENEQLIKSHILDISNGGLLYDGFSTASTNQVRFDELGTTSVKPIYLQTTSDATSAVVTYGQLTNAISGVSGIAFEIVDDLPTVGQTNKIYLVSKQNGQAPNAKDEYIWLPTGGYEKIGSTDSIDLSAYLTTSATSGSSTGMITYATSGTSIFPYFGSNTINGSTTSIGAGTYAPGYVLLQAAETTAQGQDESSIIGLTPSSISVATKEFIFSDVDDQTEINAKNVNYFTAPDAQFNINRADVGYQVVNLNTLSNLLPHDMGNIVHADNSTIYLPTSSWASTTINGQSCYIQTVSNLGNLTNYYDVIVSPSPYYIKEYAENGIYCISQATSALTFIANSTATLDQNGVYVNYITIQKQAPDQLN